MRSTDSMQRSTSSSSSSRAGRPKVQLRRKGTVQHRLAAVACRNAAIVLRDPHDVVRYQPDDSASSSPGTASIADVYSRDIRPLQGPSTPLQSAASTQIFSDDDRLLTLQLLNSHTQSIAAQGYTVHSAAVAPAGVNAVHWKQRIVELFADCKQLNFEEAERQVDAIFAKPLETPCFVAFGPSHASELDASGDKTVIGLVVGSIISNPLHHANNRACGSKHNSNDGSSGAVVPQKHLQIDTLCIDGLAQPSPWSTAAGAAVGPCDGSKRHFGDPDCRSCRKQLVCRTLLLWLLGEAGCFDHTDARMSLSASDLNQPLLCLFSQLGFEPWHEPWGSPPPSESFKTYPISSSSSSNGGGGRSGSNKNNSSRGGGSTIGSDSSNGNWSHSPAAIRGVGSSWPVLSRNGVSTLSQFDPEQQVSLAGDPQKHWSSGAMRSYGASVNSPAASKQRSMPQIRQDEEQSRILKRESVCSGAAVRLHRPAGLLLEIKQPHAITQLMVESVHEDKAVAVGQSRVGSNVLPFKRQ